MTMKAMKWIICFQHDGFFPFSTTDSIIDNGNYFSISLFEKAAKTTELNVTTFPNVGILCHCCLIVSVQLF